MKEHSQIDPRFWSTITAYFDPDVLDYSSDQILLNAARNVGRALKTDGIDSMKLAEDLKDFNTDFENEFNKATNVDWISNDEWKNKRKIVIEEIIKELIRSEQ